MKNLLIINGSGFVGNEKEKNNSNVTPMLLANINDDFMGQPRSLTELMNEFAPVFGLDIPIPEHPEQGIVAPLLPFLDSPEPSNERHLDTIIDGIYPNMCLDCD